MVQLQTLLYLAHQVFIYWQLKKMVKNYNTVDDFTVSGTTLTMTTAYSSGSKVIAKITNTVDFEDDTAIEGGSSAGSYITKL